SPLLFSSPLLSSLASECVILLSSPLFSSLHSCPLLSSSPLLHLCVTLLSSPFHSSPPPHLCVTLLSSPPLLSSHSLSPLFPLLSSHSLSPLLSSPLTLSSHS